MNATKRYSLVQTVLRVAEGERYIGDILLDDRDRVWRSADTIPSDIVLKALVQYTRQGETSGRLISRQGQRVYYWFTVGAVEQAA